MKKSYSIIAAAFITVCMFLPQHSIAQAPEKMSCQAVIRNGSDDLVTNAQVGMQISIVQGSADGTVVYTETQTPTTNANGLVSIEFGGGPGFSSIDWGSGIYFIKTETDPTGGSNYTITGTSQLLSVPYALYAPTSGNGGATSIDELSDGKSDNDGTNDGSSIFLGINAGLNDDGTHNRNVGIGYQTLLFNTVGSSNTAIGFQTMFNNSTGYHNTAIGIQALSFNTTGTDNTANGSSALWNNTTGSSNTASGYQAGYNNSTGNGNVFVGHNSGYNELGSNTLYIENSSADAGEALIYGEFDNNILRTNSEFQIGDPAGTGFAFPSIDGAENQVLQTDGLGNISWQTPILSSGLELLDEGSGLGWRLIGSDPANYGPIGFEAIDFSRSIETGHGALGTYSFASGHNTRATGETSTAMGRNSYATGYGSTAIGNSTASGYGSMAAGWNVTASGDYSTALGAYSEASGIHSTTFGRYNVGGGDPITWVATDPLFEIGNGEFNNPSNALTVLKNGSITAPTFTSNLIDIAGNKALITKEYADLNYQLTSNAVTEINDLSDGKSDANGSSVFLGANAGLNDSGTNNKNVAVGYEALFASTTGAQNTAYGYQALFANTTGNENTANGYRALYSNTLGTANVANGNSSLVSNTLGSENVANGFRALLLNTTGTSNTANGYQALYYNTTGNRNTANGSRSLGFNTTADNNTASGYEAIYNNTIGSNNTANGHQALYNNSTGNNNTAVGYQADVSSNNLTNATAIGANAVVSQSNSLVLGNNSKVGIGNSAPIYDLHVGNGNISSSIGANTQIAVSNNDNSQRVAISGLAKSSTGTKVEAQMQANGSPVNGPSVIIGSASDHPVFFRTDNLTRMTIDTNGNVGILNQSPTELLSVGEDFGSTLTGNRITIGDNDNFSGLNIGASLNSRAFILWNPFTTKFQVGTVSGGVSYGNTLTIDDGRLGINNESPNYDIHVGDGNINASNLSNTRAVVSDNDNGERAAFLGLSKTSNGTKVEAQLEANGSNSAGPSVIVGSVSSHPLFLRTGNLTRMTVTTSGDVGLGTSAPTEKLHVVGNICYTGSIGACSDIRYKKNLIPVSQILPKLKSIGVYTYTWDTVLFPEKGFTKERQLGVIAQELELIFPEMVQTDREGYKTVDYAKMSAALLQGLKEQQDIIEALTDKLESTDERLNKLEALLDNSQL